MSDKAQILELLKQIENYAFHLGVKKIRLAAKQAMRLVEQLPDK